MTPSNYRQKLISEACVQAVVFNAGYNLSPPMADTYGIDGTIVNPAQGGINRVDYQLKSTTHYEAREFDLAYDLRVEDYNRLVLEDNIPRVLLLYTMPAAPDQWLAQSEAETCLRHCLYWVSLMGQPVLSNVSTRRVYVPRDHILDPSGLVNMFHQLTS